MDNRDRVLGTAVDRGAYEIECEDSTNSYDLDADGLVNLHEFNGLSKAWLGHDPNDPAWLANPNLADPNLSEGWYEWKYKYNFEPTGNSQYSIDLADLIVFVEDAPWLWKACWLTDEDIAAMMTGSEQLSMLSSGVQTEAISTAVQLSSATAGRVAATEHSELRPELVEEVDGLEIAVQEVPEKSIAEQITNLQNAIEFLEQIWLEEPDIQQTIDPNDWQEFINSVQGSPLELQIEDVQLE